MATQAAAASDPFDSLDEVAERDGSEYPAHPGKLLMSFDKLIVNKPKKTGGKRSTILVGKVVDIIQDCTGDTAENEIKEVWTAGCHRVGDLLSFVATTPPKFEGEDRRNLASMARVIKGNLPPEFSQDEDGKDLSLGVLLKDMFAGDELRGKVLYQMNITPQTEKFTKQRAHNSPYLKVSLSTIPYEADEDEE